MKNIITLGVLLALTTTATIASKTMQDSRYLVFTILGLGVVKLALVAFQFMELKKAHLFWKSSLTLVIGLFLIASCFIIH